MNNSETLVLTESETAQQLGISISGLRTWRNSGSGPRYVRLGRLIRYLARDVQSWLDDHAVEVESFASSVTHREYKSETRRG
jgi:predicted DNA-binding transcriptional regulator AlpA